MLPAIREITAFLLFLVIIPSYAGPLEDAAAEFSRLIGKGEAALQESDYPKALEYFTKAELAVDKYDLPSHKLVAKFNIAKTYGYISSYADALEYYLEALAIAKAHPELEESRLTIYVNIGSIYEVEKDYLSALEYFKKANTKAREIGSDYNLCLSAVNISSLYNVLGDYTAARRYLDEIKDKPMDNLMRQVRLVNYAESYFKEGRIDKAHQMMEQVLATVDVKSEKECYFCVVKLLSEIYASRGKLDMAIFYARKGIAHARVMDDKIKLYDHIAGLYLKNGDYGKAFKYKDSLLSAKDSLSRMVKRSVFEANKVRLKIQDYQSEARHNKEKGERERTVFILVIVLGIVLCFFIYRSLRNRIIKQKQQNIIAANRQKIDELELEKLSNDAAEKNRKLSAKALYLSGRNELIEEMIGALSQAPDIQGANVQNYIKTLRQHIKVDEEWDDFITYFGQVNPDFLKTLQVKHPQLTPADIRFICYLYMNLELKEISSIFSITPEAARKRKQRIARKMDVDIDGLREYILSLNG